MKGICRCSHFQKLPLKSLPTLAGWHPGSVPRSDFEDWGRRQRGGDGRLARGHDVARDDWLGLLNQVSPCGAL